MSEASPRSPNRPKRLFTFSSGGWVVLLSVFFTLVAAGLVLYPVYETGFGQAVGDGQHVETYGFDLSNLTIARAKLIASGKPKDGIHAIPAKLAETITPAEVELMHQNEHIVFLVGSDRVIGVVVNGEARAYPVRILNIHEVVNDVVGETPIVVSWSPLCDSAVVFDRRVDGETAAVEFGVTGLLLDCDLIMFDRRGEAKQESLWPQLGMKAIAGPAAGKRLKYVASELVSWKQWTTEHPGTRVLMGLRTLKGEYTDAQDPVNLYLANDDLRFPAFPVWGNEKGLPKKARVVARSRDGENWVVTRAGAATTAAATGSGAGNEYVIPSFVFAWYAQHADDSDYSALGVGGGG